jgi:hypothetical protein
VRRTVLSKKELRRAGILARVKAGELRAIDAGELMRVSYRQAKLLWKRYQSGGAAKLHKARPKPSQWKPSPNHPWRKSVLFSPSVSSIRSAAAAIQALR